MKAEGAIRELTPRVIVLGLLLSVVMGAANVYLGLKAGLTVSASIPAAVVAMLILRSLLKTGTVLEANQVQTAASAGESLAAGIIFTMPALLLIGVWQDFDYLTTSVIAFTGGLLGILFMIPMRRVFILDSKELKYPEGVACATVLEAGAKSGGSAEALSVIFGGLAGAAFKVFGGFFGLLRGTLESAMVAGNRVLYFGGDVSPALVAVGFIVRLNVSVLIFIGGGIAWLIGIPLLGGGEVHLDNPLDGAWTLWSSKIRYVGVGAMVVGGAASIVNVRHGLAQAFRELRQRLKPQAAGLDHVDRDISSRSIIVLATIATVLVAGVYYTFTGAVAITAVVTVIMLIMSFFFTAVASYIVGLVGNSNSPVSGMTITAVLFTGGVLYVFGFTGVQGMMATLGVAAIVCCAACTSGDVCNDLKTGSLVGAAPFRQQKMQVLGVFVASLVMAPILQLLHSNTPGGIGGRALPAPQANLFASLARGFFGDEALPWDMVEIGVGVGLVILAVDYGLAKAGARFRAHLMPIAVGMYLPFGLATPILIGGLLAHLATRGAKGDAEVDRKAHRGVLFSSGVIAGESLAGIGIAGVVALGNAAFLFFDDLTAAVDAFKHALPSDLITGLSAAACIAALVVFYLATRPGQAE